MNELAEKLAAVVRVRREKERERERERERVRKKNVNRKILFLLNMYLYSTRVLTMKRKPKGVYSNVGSRLS